MQLTDQQIRELQSRQRCVICRRTVNKPDGFGIYLQPRIVQSDDNYGTASVHLHCSKCFGVVERALIGAARRARHQSGASTRRAVNTPQPRRKGLTMADSSSGGASGGIGFLGMLAILFIVLKLTGVIGWSWWWVLAPVWIPLTLLLLLLLIIGGVLLVTR